MRWRVEYGVTSSPREKGKNEQLMKKIMVAVISSILIVSVAVFAQSLSVKQAEKVMSDALSDEGYNCDVEVGDVDENGVKDIAIEYISGNEDEQIIMLLATVTGATAEISNHLKWRADKVFVLVAEDVYYAKVSDCGVCYEFITEEDSSEDDAVNCIKSIWTEVDE